MLYTTRTHSDTATACQTNAQHGAKKDLWLVNPPFSMPAQPVISIPALAAYLTQRNIDFAAFDLNLAFFERLLAPERILRGHQFIQQRFFELNQRAQLDFTEMMEYTKLFSLLLGAKRWAGKINLLKTGFFDFSDLKNEPEPVKILYIQLTAAYAYPEFSLLMHGPIFAATSTFYPFSSSEIIASTQKETLYSTIIENLLRTYLSVYIPKIIGISVSYYNQILPAFSCAHLIKKMAPQVHVTMGGSSIFTYFRNVKEKKLFELVDSLVIDDGEIPLERLFSEVSSGKHDLDSVPGLVYLKGESIKFNNSPPPLNFKTLPVPDYTIFPLNSYLTNKSNIRLPVRLSKGCSWGKCSFCRTRISTINAYQRPSLEQMYRILKQTVHETGIKKIHIADESISPEALEYISKQIINEHLGIDWDLQTRFHKSLTKQRCVLFKNAGCSRIYFGAESLSDRVLSLMRKGITVRLIEDTLKQIQATVPITLFMIIGFPTETEEEAWHSFTMLQRFLQAQLIDSYRYSLFAIYTGSEIAENPSKFGIDQINRAPDSDLAPDISDFQGTGMSRETMRRLYMRFSMEVPQNEQVASTHLLLNGNKLRINYDMHGISETIRNQVITFPITPFSSWLRSNKDIVLPRKK